MKAIFAFLGFVVLVIFVVILISRGGGNQVEIEPVPHLAEAAASNAEFRLTEAGPITAEEEHFRIAITISRDSREVVVYQGYNDVRVASRSFSNSQAAFEEFLSALDRAGYLNERSTSLESEAGICPTRRRHVFESNQFDEEFRRWTTDCREKGNFGGIFATIRTLYRNQIPEFSEFISDTRRATGLQL